MRHRFRFELLSLAAAGLLTFGLGPPAHATPTLQVGIGGTSTGTLVTPGDITLAYTNSPITVTGTVTGPPSS